MWRPLQVILSVRRECGCSSTEDADAVLEIDRNRYGMSIETPFDVAMSMLCCVAVISSILNLAISLSHTNMCWNALHILCPDGAHAIDYGKTASNGDAEDKVEVHRLRAKNVRPDAMDETNTPEIGGKGETEAIDKEDARDRSAIADVEVTPEATRGAASAASEGITEPRDQRCEQERARDRGIVDDSDVGIQCEAGALSSIFPSLPRSLSPPSPTCHIFPVSAGRAVQREAGSHFH